MSNNILATGGWWAAGSLSSRRRPVGILSVVGGGVGWSPEQGQCQSPVVSAWRLQGDGKGVGRLAEFSVIPTSGCARTPWCLRGACKATEREVGWLPELGGIPRSGCARAPMIYTTCCLFHLDWEGCISGDIHVGSVYM